MSNCSVCRSRVNWWGDVAVPCPHPINVGIVVVVVKGRSLMEVVINTGLGPVCGMMGQLAFCFRDTGNNSSSHMDAKRAADARMLALGGSSSSSSASSNMMLRSSSSNCASSAAFSFARRLDLISGGSKMGYKRGYGGVGADVAGGDFCGSST